MGLEGDARYDVSVVCAVIGRQGGKGDARGDDIGDAVSAVGVWQIAAGSSGLIGGDQREGLPVLSRGVGDVCEGGHAAGGLQAGGSGEDAACIRGQTDGIGEVRVDLPVCVLGL